jgi:sugar O-acyltransferase (sialic acid O-acetyltransferase NeuD family)
MLNNDVVIIGAGGHGSELYSYIQDLAAAGKAINFAGFIDENKPCGPWNGTKVLGGFEELGALARRDTNSVTHYITAVGNNRIRSELVEKVEGLGWDNLAPWVLQHPDAKIGYGVEIGEGACLAPGSVITTNVRIGKHCIINVNASISHDSHIGDFCNINPGVVIAGNVRLGVGCYIGAGATVIDKITIGDWAIIGAGAVVVADIPSRVTAVGVPAKVIKYNA